MDKAILELNGQRYELPVVVGSEDERAIDISTLRKHTGHITLDAGYGNTGSCRSAITFLDGEKGILHYRGYPIEQLAEHSNFQEVAYLLAFGELPVESDLEEFRAEVSKRTSLPEGIYRILDQYPTSAHPMGVISAVMSSLSAYYPEYCVPTLSVSQRREVIAQLMAQFKLIVSYFYRRTMGQEMPKTRPELGYAADFLHLMFSRPGQEIDPKVAKALDQLLILHADHEQNCSASTVRVVASSQANVYACVSGGIAALWGQRHGGANQAVLEMLQSIQNDGGDYKKYIGMAKDKAHPFRLMGFGHRVYKNFDPRAKIIKKACEAVLDNLNIQDPLLDIARGLEEEALRDSYFVERKLYPNVDFYSGIIYRALGIPTNMFTVMFALGRLPGWLSQWKELREDPGQRIARPRQVYVGATQRDYP